MRQLYLKFETVSIAVYTPSMASCVAIDVLRGMCSETSIDIHFDRIVPQGRRRDASSELIVMAGNTYGRMDDKNEEDTS